ncbi:MAG: hypothetical protein IJE10_10845 [Clostridia bacterium]|nr:hypothetical protein [Clostridia bacterium]
MNFKKMLLVVLSCMLVVVLVGCGVDSSTTGAEKVAPKEAPAQDSKGMVEKIFVDDENCIFKITDIEEDNLWGYTLKAELENKTDKNLMFTMKNVSVNGYMCDPFWAETVQSGKKAKSDISFFDTEFEELGIEKVEEIEFTLSVYDEDDWMSPKFVEETFVFTTGE